METSSWTTGPVRLAFVTPLVMILGAAGARAETPLAATRPAPVTFNVRIKEPATAAAVRRALEGASELLTDERCRAVLSDFEDGSGRPLTEALEATGLGLDSYLGLLFFYDGSTLPSCSNPEVMANTEAGSRVVMICGLRFFEMEIHNPFRAQVFLIHEVLHTLGLGENPPYPHQITRQVVKRCKDVPLDADRGRVAKAE
jgi:hypothetical protein